MASRGEASGASGRLLPAAYSRAGTADGHTHTRCHLSPRSLIAVTVAVTLVTTMRASLAYGDLTGALFGKTRRAILSLLLGHADEAFYLRQIVRATGVGLGPAQRELKQLADAGVVRRSVLGRKVYYQADRGSPLFEELKGLIDRSHGKVNVPDAAVSGTGDSPPATGEGQRIAVSKEVLAAFCRRHHIRSLAFFGSVLRDDFRPDSDVDVLVEFDPGETPGFLKLADMEAELSTLLGGRRVDLRTPQDLSRYFRDEVVRQANVVYAAAG